MINLKKFKSSIYIDGANIKDFKNLSKNTLIKGFTTNPSLMRSSGVLNYLKFAKQVLKIIKRKPVSFEIFADDANNIMSQALKIKELGENVFVKIPIITTNNKSNADLIVKLNRMGIKINVTAIFTLNQSLPLIKKLDKKTEIILSIFAGRIADTGVNPKAEIKKHISACKNKKNIKILWASVREVYNIIEAEEVKCHIVTVPPSILKKTKNFNKSLEKYSQETVKNFYDDAKKSGYSL